MMLRSPSQEVIDSLSSEPGVDKAAVVRFLTGLNGMTEDEAIAMLNTLTFASGWNIATHLACAEGIDYAMSNDI